MRRKTIKVSEVVEKANEMLEKSTCDSIGRKMVALFVSDLLHATGNYDGFNYLESESNIHGGHYGKDGRIFFYLFSSK